MQLMWLLIGAIAFVLGAIGIPLPGWPTTIFWIIAAYCFANSRPEWRDWIYARPGVGKIVEDFNERGVMSRTSKIAAFSGMAIGGGIATFILWRQWHWLGAIWVTIAIGALLVASRKTE